MVAIIKYLLQSGVKPGEHSARIYTLEQATTKENMRPDSCWSLKGLQAMAQ
jgi:ribose transport system substrate-binding protein